MDKINKTNNNKNDYYIKKEEKNIFPIIKEVDDKLMENKVEINWNILLFPFTTSLFKRLIHSMFITSQNKSFYEGMKYEYGLDNTKIDLKRAYKIYEESANSPNSSDYYSMCKMYLIHFMEYNKFGIKRNRNFEKYYLFKAFALSPFHIIDNSHYLANKVYLEYEIALHLDIEDPDGLKTFEFLDYMNHNSKYKFITDREINLIKSVIIYRFDFGLNINEEIYKMNECYLYSNPETAYKVACMLMKSKKDLAIHLLEFCEKHKYYRSYYEYGNLLYGTIENKEKAKDVLREGLMNGNHRCIFPYYLALVIDHHKAIFKTPQKMKKIIFILMDLLIKDCIIGNYNSLFQFLFWLKLCIKHFGMKEEIIQRYQKILIELFEFLNNSTTNNEFLSQKSYTQYELFFAYGFAYYVGFKPLIERNYDKSLALLKKSFKMTESKYNIRFIYGFIYSVRKKLFQQGKITIEKLKKTEKKLFHLYYYDLEEDGVNNYSYSAFYYLAGLYNKGIGTEIDDIRSYFFYNQIAVLKKITYLGGGSIIAFYRHYKSIRKVSIKKKEQLIKKIILSLKDDKDIGDDGLLCLICFDNKRNFILIPCKHLLCKRCLDTIMEIKPQCPFCREIILFSVKIKFI